MKKIFNKYMKTLQLIFLLSILGYCLADNEQYNCESNFEIALKSINENQCTLIGSTCSYNDTHRKCVTKHQCSEEDGTDSTKCRKIIPTDFYSSKCDIVGGDCRSKPRECGDWKIFGLTYDSNSRDICSDLSPGDNGDRCIEVGGSCNAHFKKCERITTNTNSKCLNNIPENPWEQCEWKTIEGTDKCVETKRICGTTLYVDADKDLCKKLEKNNVVTDKENQLCIFDEYNSQCKQDYIECKYHRYTTVADCERHMPLNSENNGYDYTKKCTLDESTEDKCKPVTRKCSEYNKSPIEIPEDLINDELCSKLEVTEEYYRCAYDEENKICKEEYKSCEDYISKKVETNRNGCTSIILSDKTKKCVYDINKDECVTKPIYEKCEDYKGKDKKTCESIILSPATRPYCILDKDSECKERPITCAEAFKDKDVCLNVARASDNNKICAYYGGCPIPDCDPEKPPKYCYEEYTRCEDYLGGIRDECEDIILYDGKKCKWDSSSNRCRTNSKICEDAVTEEECKLIAETGVSDTERKVCFWDDTNDKCIETFKYCSDYRERCSSGQACIDFCEKNIKPYDESGKNLDFGFKCIYDIVGCQKVQVECSDADDNPILCELYSDKIYDRDKKYCGFFEGTCKEYYMECKDVEFSSPSNDAKCTGNIIKVQDDIICGACKVDGGKCIQKKNCEDFDDIGLTSSSKKYICESLDSHCSYNSGECQYKEYKDFYCTSKNFYTEDENNSGICEQIEVSDPFQKCIIKEDKSGCEIVYKQLPYSASYTTYSESQENENQESSSGFPIKGINLIIILLCFLF